jgi:proline dehydrogenase
VIGLLTFGDTLFFMATDNCICFDNTEYAFEYKKNSDLKNAHFLFSVIGRPWLVSLGLKLVPFAIKWNFPFVKSILRKTIFQQFVGGEDLEATTVVVEKMNSYHVQVILDYGVEGGGNGEMGFDHSAGEFIKVIDFAATQANIPFMSIKVTGLSRVGLLEKLDILMNNLEGTLLNKYDKAIDLLNSDEKVEWQKVKERMFTICERASEKKVGVLIDAEETWIQDPVDALSLSMMDSFNRGKRVVYNTLQLYRTDRLKFLKDCYDAAEESGFILGVKLVRGAYMENERKRAAQMNYPSPIQLNKESCDHDFNAAIQFSITHINKISLIVASHNEESNLYATQLLTENELSPSHPHVHFSQLYGMSDNVTFNLAKAGYSVSKYLPFGPIKDVIPYLMRRAQENSAVSGLMGRELSLLKKEINRRVSKINLYKYN